MLYDFYKSPHLNDEQRDYWKQLQDFWYQERPTEKEWNCLNWYELDQVQKNFELNKNPFKKAL